MANDWIVKFSVHSQSGCSERIERCVRLIQKQLGGTHIIEVVPIDKEQESLMFICPLAVRLSVRFNPHSERIETSRLIPPHDIEMYLNNPHSIEALGEALLYDIIDFIQNELRKKVRLVG